MVDKKQLKILFRAILLKVYYLDSFDMSITEMNEYLDDTINILLKESTDDLIEENEKLKSKITWLEKSKKEELGN